MCLTPIHAGFFTAFDHGKYIRDQELCVKTLERRQQPCRLILRRLVGGHEAIIICLHVGNLDHITVHFRDGMVGFRFTFPPRFSIRFQRVKFVGILFVLFILKIVNHDG